MPKTNYQPEIINRKGPITHDGRKRRPGAQPSSAEKMYPKGGWTPERPFKDRKKHLQMENVTPESPDPQPGNHKPAIANHNQAKRYNQPEIINQKQPTIHKNNEAAITK